MPSSIKGRAIRLHLVGVLTLLLACDKESPTDPLQQNRLTVPDHVVFGKSIRGTQTTATFPQAIEQLLAKTDNAPVAGAQVEPRRSP